METTNRRWRKVTPDDNMFDVLTCDTCGARAFFLQEQGSGNTRRVIERRCTYHTNLEAMCDMAQDAFERLTPEEQRQHRREQTISFVVGNLHLDGIPVTAEQVARAIDLKEFQRCIRETRAAFAKLSPTDQMLYKAHQADWYDDGGLNLPDLA